MSLKVFVSRAFAVQSCICAAVAFSFACNAVYGAYMIGYSLSTTLLVGAVLGSLIAAAIGLLDLLTSLSGRSRDFAVGNAMGVVASVAIYSWNVILHMNVLGWTVSGLAISIALGLACGNAYAAACAAVKRLAN